MAVALLIVGLLVFLAHLFSALFQRTRMPDVLPLMALGLIIGPVTGMITPEAVGRAGEVFALIVLGVILFESGLGLDFQTLRDSLGSGVRLTVLGVVVTLVVVGVAATAMGPFTPLEGLMLGAILTGTSPAVVIPMTQMMKVRQHTRTVLLLESTFSDVLCIVLSLALIQAARYEELRPGLVVGQIIASFTLALLIGFGGALFWSHMLGRVRRHKNSIFTTPAFMFIMYGLAEILGYSGAIAALAFGFTLGNIELVSKKIQTVFKGIHFNPTSLSESDEVLFGEVVFLLKTFFFVYIGASIRFTDPYLVAAGLGLTAAIFLLRVPVVWLVMGADSPRFDASVAWIMIPKGLAAAILAGLPEQEGIHHGAAMKPIVYAVILFSIVTTALLGFFIERGRMAGALAVMFPKFKDLPPEKEPESSTSTAR